MTYRPSPIKQIEELGLPTRPTKKTDSRARDFDGESVEVDAIPPRHLRNLVADAIVGHVDRVLLGGLMKVEEAERETLGEFRLRLTGAS